MVDFLLSATFAVLIDEGIIDFLLGCEAASGAIDFLLSVGTATTDFLLVIDGVEG